jgi:hypothetical protein
MSPLGLRRQLNELGGPARFHRDHVNLRVRSFEACVSNFVSTSTSMSPTVRWGDNESFSDFGSPISHTSSSGSQISTGSLDYINAQLQSHGFLYDGGLSLDGLSDKELDKVVKCMLKLLGQRIVRFGIHFCTIALSKTYTIGGHGSSRTTLDQIPDFIV